MKYYSLLQVLLLQVLLTACQHKEQALKEPESVGHTPPVSRQFDFLNKLKAITLKESALNTARLPERKTDLDRQSGKPFYTGEAIPLIKAPDSLKFSHKAFNDSAFYLEKIPSRKLRFRHFVLPTPKRVKALPPRAREGSARGVMEIGSEEGLTGTTLNNSLVDHNGMLWIATDKGLCYYDGEYCEQIQIGQGYNAGITYIFEDHNGELWLATYAGNLYRLNPKTRTLSQVIDFQHEFNQVIIMTIAEDNKHRLWVSVPPLGAVILDPAAGTIRTLSDKTGLHNKFTTRVWHDSDNRMWLTGSDGVDIVDPDHHRLLHPGQELKQRLGIVEGITQDDKGSIWLGTYGKGIFRFDPSMKNITWISREHGLINDHVSHLLAYDKKLWIGSDTSTVTVYDPAAKTLQTLRLSQNNAFVMGLTADGHGQMWIGLQYGSGGGGFLVKREYGSPGNFSRAQGLSDNNVWSLLKDSKERIWIGTYNGVDIYDPRVRMLKHLGMPVLPNNRISALGLDYRKRVWIGSSSGDISIFDAANGTIRTIPGFMLLPNLTAAVSVIYTDAEGRTWLGDFKGSVCFVDKEGKTITKVKLDSVGVNISFIREDSRHRIWIGTYGNGLAILDPSLRTVSVITEASGLTSNQLTAWQEDDEHKFWLVSEKGTERIDLDSHKSLAFGPEQGLPAWEGYSIAKRHGKLYIGTSAGLAIVSPPKNNKKEWPIRVFGKPQGLTYTDFNQNAFLLTQDGTLWAGVEQTLLLMDEPAATPEVTRPEIVEMSILGQPVMFSSPQEKVLTNDTLRVAGADSVYIENRDPNSKTRLKDRGVIWSDVTGPFNMPVALSLPYDQNYLAFRFTGLQLNNPAQMTYRYRMEGIDQTWSAPTEEGVSDSYRNLPSGNYVFKVVVKTAAGNWSAPATLQFKIRPPWWNSWLAWVGYVLLFAGLIRAYIAYRSRHLKQQNKMLETRVAERTEELNLSLKHLQSTQSQLIQSEKMASLGELTAGIAHEIQNPLNFVNNFAEVSMELVDEASEEIRDAEMAEASAILADVKANLAKIVHHGKRADGIVKGMLAHSRASTGAKELADLNVLADEYLRLSYHGLRAKDKSLNVELITDFDPDLPKINIIPQDIGRVILNLINNALQAVAQRQKEEGETYKPRVSVSTRRTDNKVALIVRDNGPGISEAIKDKIMQPFFTTKPTGEGTGLGLSLSYDIIVKGHSGWFTVSSKEKEFAEFTMLLPL